MVVVVTEVAEHGFWGPGASPRGMTTREGVAAMTSSNTSIIAASSSSPAPASPLTSTSGGSDMVNDKDPIAFFSLGVLYIKIRDLDINFGSLCNMYIPALSGASDAQHVKPATGQAHMLF
jgi:hypothetical protein